MLQQYRYICFFFPVANKKDVAEPEMRRRAASLSTPHRGSDVNVDPLRSAILFRDARGVSILCELAY